MTDRAHMPAATTVPNLLCYEDLLEAHSTDFDWPEFDENTASSLCYTSGTTGNPKGVLYSHRSTVLHTYAAALPDALNCSAQRRRSCRWCRCSTSTPGACRTSPAWSAPSWCSRARPRRQVAARAVRGRGRHPVGRRADGLAGPARARRGQRPEVQHHAPHHHRRLGLPAGDDARLPGALRRPGAARLGHDRDQPAGHRVHAQAAAPGARRRGSASPSRPSRAAPSSAST